MSEVMQASPENPGNDFDRIAHLDTLIASVDERLASMQPEIDLLMTVRHDHFTLPKTKFDQAHTAIDQLNPEPTYNDVFVYGYDPRVKVTDDDPTSGGDLNARRGAAFHKGEVYEEGEYAQAILDVADRLGFVKKEVAQASDPLDRQIGIADSDLKPVGEVEAIVVPGAASFSNVMRLRDALRNIEQGRVQTDTLIIATTDRPVEDAERAKVAGIGFRGGETEFESLVLALSDLTHNDIDHHNTEALPVKLGVNTFEGRLLRTTVDVGGNPIQCMVVSTPYDPERTEKYDKDGNPVKATRANTDETFVAALSLLKPGAGKLLIESHDTWAIEQGVVAEQIFGVAGKDIIATGPRKLDRVIEKTNEKGHTYLTLTQPEGVVDEIAKTYSFLTHVRVKAENERQWLSRELDSVRAANELGLNPEFITQALLSPIPNMEALRGEKIAGFKEIPIDRAHEAFHEPVVRVADYDIAGQNYYSRPNATVDEPIPGVPRYPTLRRGLAETLDTLNLLIAHPSVTEFFGSRVELYVEDGLRTTATQAQLFEKEVPALIKRNHPELSDAEVIERRKSIIAAPSTDENRPSPHSTGGAVDVILRYRQTPTPFYNGERSKVWIGHHDGDTATTIDPDYYETHLPQSDQDVLAQRNRRAFYSIMTGAAFNHPTDLAVNPTEIWHWSRGDQLWAKVKGVPNAYYGPVAQ